MSVIFMDVLMNVCYSLLQYYRYVCNTRMQQINSLFVLSLYDEHNLGHLATYDSHQFLEYLQVLLSNCLQINCSYKLLKKYSNTLKSKQNFVGRAFVFLLTCAVSFSLINSSRVLLYSIFIVAVVTCIIYYENI